jgi:hypothetical protein
MGEWLECIVVFDTGKEFFKGLVLCAYCVEREDEEW